MKLKTILAILLTTPLAASAGVNPKNANFYITYNDVSLKSGDHELEITRTYNSNSTDRGWFGYGWGSTYETRLVVLPDGSAVVKEIGSGATTYYRTQDQNAIREGVTRIVQAAAARENLTQEAADQLAVQLLSDEEKRLEAVIKYEIKTVLPVGAALDDYCGKGSLTRVTEGYQRKDCNRFGQAVPVIDTFDLQGRLIRRTTNDGYAIVINYREDGGAQIHDTVGQNIELSWTPEGRVAHVKGDKVEVTYTYENQNLVLSEDLVGNAYRYSYDRNHDLTRIRYIDDSKMFISYSPRVSGMADAVTHRNGDQETYVYGTDPENAKHYWTRYTMISSTGQTSSKQYDFEDQTSQTGATEHRMVATADAKGATQTRLDSKGRVIYKLNEEGAACEYVYHPRSDKLILILTNDLRTEFHYNDGGDLIGVQNSDGQIITLDYGKDSKIVRLVELNQMSKVHREVTFKYNTNGKPTEITLVGLGHINVEYDDQGEITKVHSAQGAKMALQVTQAFQDLLKIVSPSGAKL